MSRGRSGVSMVKLLVCVDIEGISGVNDYRMLDSETYERTKALATGDVNAVALGVREAIPDATFDIFDAHCGGGNLWEEDLAPGCRVLGGGWVTTLAEMVDCDALSTYDGAILLGQHAAAGIRDGFVSHTNTLFAALRINGRDAGEASQLAWLLGHYGVPVLFVSGGAAVAREVEALLEEVPTVVVKEVGEHRGVARCIPVDEAHEKLREQARSCARHIEQARVQTVGLPVTVDIIYATPGMAETAARFPGYTRADEHTVSFIADDYVEGWRAYNTSRTIGPMHARLHFFDEVVGVDGVEERYKTHVERFVREWLEGDLPYPSVRF